jgi:hypothetical protein
MERAGVILSALDEFSGNIQKYIADLRKVQAAGNQLSEQERAAASAATKAGGSFSMSGEKVVKYGMAASICTGQMEALGVSNKGVARGVSVAADAMTGMLGPIGLVIAAIGAAVAIAIALVNAKKKLKKAIDDNADALIAMAKESGVANETERQMIIVHQASTRSLLAKAEAELTAVEAGKISLGFWQKVREIFGDTTIRATALAAKQGELALRIRELNTELDAEILALRGGSKAMDAAATAAERRKQAIEQAQKAEKAAQIEYLGLLREKVEAQTNADDLTIEGLVLTALAMQQAANLERQAVEMSVENAKNKALQIELIEIRLQKRLKDLHNKAEAEIKANRAKSDAEEKASEQRRAAYIAQSMSIIGAAVGETAAGNTKAWKQAAVQSIQIAAAEATKWLAIQAAKYAFVNPALAALYAASIVAVNAVASKAVADLNRTGEAAGSTGGGSAPTGPTILTPGFDPATRASALAGGSYSVSGGAFAPTINLAVHGDAPADKIGLSLRSAQQFLDENMPAWEARNKRLGRRF